MVSAAEVALGDPAAAMAVLADGRRLLAAEGGPDDWRTSHAAHHHRLHRRRGR